MGAKTLLLAIVSIFAVTPEIFGANTRDICANPPVVGFPGSTLSKWGYYPDAKKCKLFTWGGVEGNGNHFDSEKECMDACRPAQPSKPLKNYSLVSGQCVCRCPRCDVVTTTEANAQAMTVSPKSIEGPTTTTEKTVQATKKLSTSTDVTTAHTETTEPTTSTSTTLDSISETSPFETTKNWISKLFSF